jgi:hypothetical protein
MAELTQNTKTPAPKKGKSKIKSFFQKLFLSIFLLIVLFVAGFILYSNYTYSDGNRAGILIKFSKKGYIFKTHEGELNLGGINPMPGNTMAIIFGNFQ